MRVLISGAGIAGPTLAYWLSHYGFEPTIVEKAPRLRMGGYVVDFWGAGFDIAERMGFLPELLQKGYAVQELRVVNRSGKKVAGFPVKHFSGRRRAAIPRFPRCFGRNDLRQDRRQGRGHFWRQLSRIEQNDQTVRVAFAARA